MRKRVKWTYVAEFDYILERRKGEWVVGFLNDENYPYECPTTTDLHLVKKLKKIVKAEDKKIEVTVEIDEKLDKQGKQHPVLVDVREH